jgi:hypothetical protein
MSFGYTFSAISLSSEEYEPDLYFLYITDSEDERLDYLLTENKKIVFFTDQAFIKYIHKKLGYKILRKNLYDEINLVCQVGKTINLIKNGEFTEDSDILNVMNFILDTIYCIEGYIIPREKKNILYKFADYMTFSSSLTDFFREEKISREEVLESIHWGLGYIFANATIVNYQPKIDQNIDFMNLEKL